MYRHGLAYRIVNPDGSKVPLGRDYQTALRRYYLVMQAPAVEPVDVSAMWKRHRKGARQRGIAFTITEDHLREVLERQGGVCAVTGLWFRMDKPPGLRIRPWTPSIDRIDGALGYDSGNVRIVCAFVNIAMNGFGESFFADVLWPLVDAAVQARQWASENG
jgi:hypothetical protein